MLIAKKDDVKANDLEIEVVDSWENHVNLIGAICEIKKINTVSYIDGYNCTIGKHKSIIDIVYDIHFCLI